VQKAVTPQFEICENCAGVTALRKSSNAASDEPRIWQSYAQYKTNNQVIATIFFLRPRGRIDSTTREHSPACKPSTFGIWHPKVWHLHNGRATGLGLRVGLGFGSFTFGVPVVFAAATTATADFRGSLRPNLAGISIPNLSGG